MGPPISDPDRPRPHELYDQAGHARTVHEGEPTKRGHALHGVPPCLQLTVCGGVGGAHVPVCRGLPLVLWQIIWRASACNGVIPVHIGLQ